MDSDLATFIAAILALAGTGIQAGRDSDGSWNLNPKRLVQLDVLAWGSPLVAAAIFTLLSFIDL